jgi:hypothetical protein
MFEAGMTPTIAGLRAGLDAVMVEDLDGVADLRLGDEIAELGRLMTALEAEALRRAGEWERRRLWMVDGSRSARACLARQWGLSVGGAGERLRLAARLREAPATRAAFARGELSYDKARALCAAVGEDLPEEAKAAFRESEAVLVESAVSLSLFALREVMEFWLAHVDPDGKRKDDEDRYAKRGLSVVETFDGIVHIEGCLDPEQGQLVLRVLRAIESKFWRADHRNHKPDNDGHNTDGHDTDGSACDPDTCEHGAAPRSDRQRMADALVEACKLAEGYDPATDTFDGKGAARPRVAAIIDLEALSQESARALWADNHQPLTPETAQRLACDAIIHGVVLDQRLVPVAYTHGKGQITSSLRAQLVLRDGGCAFPGCGVPPRACDAHHATWRSEGGHHRLDNCLLLCHHHHRLQHEGRWHTVIDHTTGRPRFQHPDGTWHDPPPSPLQLATLVTNAA